MPGSAAPIPPLRGRAVLIAESNPLLAMDLAETVGAWGGAPHMLADFSCREWLSSLHAAIVDVSLPLEGQEHLIDALREHDVPTALTTTTFAKSISDRFPGFTVFEKPVDFAAVAKWFNDL